LPLAGHRHGGCAGPDLPATDYLAPYPLDTNPCNTGQHHERLPVAGRSGSLRAPGTFYLLHCFLPPAPLSISCISFYLPHHLLFPALYLLPAPSTLPLPFTVSTHFVEKIGW